MPEHSAIPAAVRRLSRPQVHPPWHLVLDKMCFQYQLLAGEEPPSPLKVTALETVRSAYRSTPGLLEALAARHRFLIALEKNCQGRWHAVTMHNVTRLIVHLARHSPLENVGLYCDHTTGIPLIPGTAVKGRVSSWAAWEANLDSATGLFRSDFEKGRARFSSDAARRILGNNPQANEDEHTADAGDIIFMGGFPLGLPALDLEIVNPHTDPATGAWRKPVPSQFLSWTGGTTWIFPLIARPGTADPKALLAQAGAWLTEALSQSGIGAKTAADFGRFKEGRGPNAANEMDFTRKASLSDAASDETALRETLTAMVSNAMRWGKLKTQYRDLPDDLKPAARAILHELTESGPARRLRTESWFPK